MSLFIVEKPTPVDLRQGRLMQLAGLFLLLYALVLTLAPAARVHDWNAEYRWNHWLGFAVWLIGCTVVHRALARRLPERDPFLFPVAALLSGWGLLEVWRLDVTMGARQTAWLGVSLLAVWIALRLPDPLAWLRRYKYIWLTSGILLTALTFLLGVYPGGAGPRLWLGCCGVYLQPSEPLKLLLIVYLAAYLADRLPISFNLGMLLTPTLVMGGAALGLLLAQRDLGTASLFILIYTAVVYLASGKRRILVISGIILLAASIAGYLLFDVVRIRVDAWLNPWADPTGRSFQIVQSILAVASGSLMGRGPGLGSPGVVPVAHSDFIFAAIAEETGLLGMTALLALFGILVSRGFRTALYAPNKFRRYLAGGLSTYLGLQAIFITGGNLRLLPLTGVTLPFVSYGGSSLLTAFLSVCLLLLVSHRDEEEPAPLPHPTPYLVVSAAVLVGLMALVLVGGWWATIRSEALLARPDNPRWSINDRYVQRGVLMDRNNIIIDHTEGSSGSYLRKYAYPPLSATTGYTSALYGLAGLESSLDPYLRGLRGTPASRIWWDDLLYGQPPPGLNVRLTLDLELQRQADQLMEGHKGAAILLDSHNGEILAVASHPYIDPALVDENWEQFIQNKDAPLINRVTQGQYPPGTTLGAFLLAYNTGQNGLPDALSSQPDQATFTTPERTWQCAQTIKFNDSLDWPALITAGCPFPAVQMGQDMAPAQLQDLFLSLGLFQQPDLPLATAESAATPVQDVRLAAIGQENLVVTPLQMALAAAALTNDGIRPAPQIVSSVETATQGWAVLPPGNTHETVLAGKTQNLSALLRRENGSSWQVLGTAYAAENRLTWYLAGTLPEWQGAPLTVVVLLEEDNPNLAEEIGQALLQQAP